MTNTYQNLLYLSRAGATVLHLASYEWERAQGHSIGLARELSLPLYVWSQSRGLLRRSETETSNVEDTLVDRHEAQKGTW